jgi:hypothetical protein
MFKNGSLMVNILKQCFLKMIIFCRLINHQVAMTLHFSMFIPAIERLATETQQAKWLPLALNFKILGTYAQTEMGHGIVFKMNGNQSGTTF